MATPNRRETLERLHREIEAALEDNDTTQARLDSLKIDIQRALEQLGDDDETLIERLEESLVELEAEHPTLTATINAAINILSSAGI
jgi:chromosome segregation ATPase